MGEEHEADDGIPRRMVIDRRLAANSIIFFLIVAVYAALVGYAFSLSAAFGVGRAADDAVTDLVFGPLLLAMTVTIYAAIPYALVVIPLLLGIELLAARGSTLSYRALMLAAAVGLPSLVALIATEPAVLAAIPPLVVFFARANLPDPEPQPV